MSSSLITRSAGGLLLLMLAAFLPPSAQALDPNRAITQYLHNHWSVRQGFPGGVVNAITQTPDGYLWIGAENGLVRFDGVSFRLFDHASTPSMPEGHVLDLVADNDGALWVRMQDPFFLRYRNRQFEEILPLDTTRTNATRLARSVHGDLLVAVPGQPLRYSGGKFAQLTPHGGPGGLPISVTEAADGTVWVGTRDTGLLTIRNGRSVRVEGLPDLKVNALAPGDGAEVWAGTDNGLVRWDGTEITTRGVPPLLLHTQILTLVRDRDANLWVGAASGMVRVDAQGGSSILRTPPHQAAEVHAMFEDREGDLWIGGTNGLERFRDTPFLNYAIPGVSEAEDNGPLYADSSGRTWTGPSAGGLAWWKGAERHPVAAAGLDGDVVYSIAGGPGEVWVGRQRGGLTVLQEEGGAFRTQNYTAANGLAQGSIYALRRARDGAIWAGTLSGGISCLRRGRITTYTTANGLVSNSVSAIEESPDGTIWVATASGLQSFAKGRWRNFTSNDGLPPDRLNCLLQDSGGGLWIGTGAGLAVLREGRISVLPDAPESLQGEIFGMAEDGRGGLWVVTDHRVVRASLDYLAGGRRNREDVREFGVADGIAPPQGLRRDHPVVRDISGRIWLSLHSGLFVIDPARVATGAPPPVVHIEAIAVDGRPVDLKAPARFPSSLQRVAVDYAGLSLAAPERVQYRYRLEGFDRDWSAPGPAKQAVYTNLAPGSYIFHVVASNREDLREGAEAAFPIVIVPQFWQTIWFQFAAATAAVFTIVAAYRFRLHRLRAAMNLRFEERLAERTRIAQELHDTLLQGFLSASMQVHVAADALLEDSKAKPMLTRALQLMQQVIEEGRNTVRGLRADGSSLPLETVFSQIQEELGGQDEVEFRVIVAGQHRPLKPLLRDEVYRIGREALLNAFRHSRAKHIEAEIQYSARDFRLSVRDDGVGIDAKILESGCDGHWGLMGIRERADRIGARLHVFSRPSAGTEIDLDIPGHIAFQGAAGGKGRWFRKRGKE